MGGLIDLIIGRRRPADPTLEPGPGLLPRPELWFCPSPGTPDWPALARPDAFAALAADCDALQLYQEQLLHLPPPGPDVPRESLPPHGLNNWLAFREWNILPMAASEGLPVVVESPGLKEWSDDPREYASRILSSIHLAGELGGRVAAISLDEPWNAGLHLRQPPWPFAHVLEHLREMRRLVHATEPDLTIGLIEPYPSVPLDLLLLTIEAFRPAFFHLDIDYRAVKRKGPVTILQADLVRLAERCRGWGVAFGIIIWGYEEDTAEAFTRSARTLLASVQEAVIRGELRWPDRLIVQSWSATAVLGPRLIPPTLPPDGDASLWGLLRTVKASL